MLKEQLSWLFLLKHLLKPCLPNCNAHKTPGGLQMFRPGLSRSGSEPELCISNKCPVMRMPLVPGRTLGGQVMKG